VVHDEVHPEGAESELPLGSLITALADDDPELRRRAVLELGDRPEGLPVLVRRVGSEPDRTVRAALCTQLARHDVSEVVDGLIEHLGSDDAGLRVAVAGVLSRTPIATSSRIPELLVDPDPDVRILTVMVLAGLRSSGVEGWLTGLVRTDPNPNVTAAAIGELAALVGPACEASLRVALDRFPDDPFIAFSVERALTALDREPR
jgi:hypothetical protein